MDIVITKRVDLTGLLVGHKRRLRVWGTEEGRPNRVAYDVQ